MSIVRIFLGVIIGGGAVAGLLAAAVRFPMVALFLMFGGAGVGLFLLAWHGMKTGVIHARRSRYERRANPFAFWFYISFYTLIGAVVFGYGVYCVIHPLMAHG
jgi:hypothetical protein